MTDITMNYEDYIREKKLNGEELDDSPGHGSGSSQDALIDETALIEDRGGAATTFYERDAKGSMKRSDGSSVSYDRLWHLHHELDPTITPDNSEQKRREEFRQAQVFTIGSQLGMNKKLCEIAASLLSDTDLGKFGSIKEEAAILGSITLVCNRNDWWVQRDHQYVQLRDELGVSQDHINQSHHIIKTQTSV